MYVKKNYSCPKAEICVQHLSQSTLVSLSIESSKVYDYSEEASDVINYGAEE